MRPRDLTGEQWLELKRRVLYDRNERIGEGTSYGELANADGSIDDN